ncbi:WecB/TagA/CpsF family glycosyltransferase [Desulfofundulus thermosubterraneus]|uniref:N-acetylglucosaminyldiphosphoundecaprenol N-acetyl-beta-D-mannosaminyltransferase n=1 Tax=Desulfofundulus thermosubterraneus DSM 16057 TaxID=1121432 RepID=A0A1M6LCL7_9FIRM|nr:WecB/TagA/CpsF family glycosyltransferase [Desulfofundulus thermosubterraneus]SHJ68835.1 N-acetylglucosaminyldiphosphoundecaprenol N-acetyl-beta-D-mannosaminyltransferase [Desulfofundulus thermosubterraneus DSM 16057]
MKQKCERWWIEGIPVDVLTREKVVNFIAYWLDSGCVGRRIHTLNVDHVMLALKDDEFKHAILSADLVVADGMPLVWLSRVHGPLLPERVTGSDLILDLCDLSARKGYSLYFLGAAPGVAERAVQRARALYPGCRVAGFYSPSREEVDNYLASLDLVRKVNDSGANILLVAFGAPRQEKWLSRHQAGLKVGVSIGVGAAIDFLAGAVPRAPKLLRKWGLEWAYRLAREPRRLWKRYLVRDTCFLWVAIKHIFRSK